MGEFRMPSLGADMDVGTILEWRVHPGQVVHRGDIVAVVDTEKSDIEVEIFEDGVVEELLVEPGVEVPVGTPLARIAPTTPLLAPTPGPAPSSVATEPPVPAATPTPAKPALSSSTEMTDFVRASPLARKLAASRGVDLARVNGSGPGGAVLATDLDEITAEEHAAPPAAPAVPAGGGRTEPGGSGATKADHQTAMRHAIGQLMARSKRDIPHYYLATTIDLSPALDWLGRSNADRAVTERTLPAALLIRATALATSRFPTMNGFYQDGFQSSPEIHVGVAVSLRSGGLVAPAIHHADRLTLDELMDALRDLVQRARAGSLRSSEMSDPTITVTNLGDQGAEEVFGVIYPPQVALVGFGRVVERPWASDGTLGVRRVVRATLAADHRVSDGRDGGLFLAAIDELLQHPEDL